MTTCPNSLRLLVNRIVLIDPVTSAVPGAEIDAAHRLEFADQNPTITQHGIYPQLAALETIVSPRSEIERAHEAKKSRTLTAIGLRTNSLDFGASERRTSALIRTMQNAWRATCHHS